MTPATGRRVGVAQLSFVLPRSFTDAGGYGNGFLSDATWASEKLASIVSIGLLADLSSYTLEEAAQLAINNREGAVRQPDRLVDGEPMWMLTTKDSIGPTYELGHVAGDYLIALSFTFMTGGPVGVELMESVLATLEWKV